jgi:hypothetical protein
MNTQHNKPTLKKAAFYAAFSLDFDSNSRPKTSGNIRGPSLQNP